jgi:hypothetical protein
MRTTRHDRRGVSHPNYTAELAPVPAEIRNALARDFA